MFNKMTRLPPKNKNIFTLYKLHLSIQKDGNKGISQVQNNRFNKLEKSPPSMAIGSFIAMLPQATRLSRRGLYGQLYYN